MTREATCRDTGAKILPCAVCGKTLKEAEIEKLEHDWGKWKVTKEATQEAKGEKEAVCRVCGEKKTAEIPKLDKPEQVKPNVPKTDDPMEPSMWIAMGILAVAALVILVLALSAVGLANMWAAVFADVGVSVLAILNASRMLGGK